MRYHCRLLSYINLLREVRKVFSMAIKLRIILGYLKSFVILVEVNKNAIDNRHAFVLFRVLRNWHGRFEIINLLPTSLVYLSANWHLFELCSNFGDDFCIQLLKKYRCFLTIPSLIIIYGCICSSSVVIVIYHVIPYNVPCNIYWFKNCIYINIVPLTIWV